MKIINKMQPEGRQHSCLTSKGFAISGIMYAILIISLLLVLGTLKTLQNRKTIVDKLKSETVNALEINNYQDLLTEVNSLKSRLTTLENGFLDKTYPIGSIYISVSSTNPAQLFGGTWEAFGQGRTLIGAGTNGGYTFTSESTGTTVGATTNPLGEYVHTLTVAEMPSHNHSVVAGLAAATSVNTGDNSFLASGYSGTAYPSNMPFSIGFKGNNQAHNNIQPYIVTYMWKRIS